METHFSKERVSFKILPNAGLYMPGQSVPSEIRLYGEGHFLFESTERPEVLNVRIADIYLRMLPTVLAFDIDDDGVLESVEIKEADLSKFVNTNVTSGKLNTKTGEFQLDWFFEIGPQTHSLLKETMTIVVEDRGVCDLITGQFEIHRGMFKIDKYPLRGALVRGSATGCLGTDTILLSVVVAGTNYHCVKSLDNVKVRPQEVWVCPGDHVELCWMTVRSNCHGNTIHDRVRIDPDGIEIKLPSNNYLIEVPSNYATNPIEYRATVLDPSGKSLASDTILVHVYENDWLPMNAQPDPLFNRWTLSISPQIYSASMYADYIQLISGKKNCLEWDYFTVLHTDLLYPNSLPNLTTTVKDSSETPISPVQIVGNWSFFGLDKTDEYGNIIENAPHPNDYKIPICFRLRGTCTKR